MKRFIRSLLKLVLGSAVLAGILYTSSGDFGRNWRQFVISQVAERGIYLEFDSLILNPFGGLVARDVRVFTGQDRQHMLASMDRLNLELNYGRLLQRQLAVEALELSHADLVLPVNPEKLSEGVIELKDFSARAYLLDERLDLRQAEGILSGIKVSLTGNLTLPRKGKQERGPDTPATAPNLSQVGVQRQHRRGVQVAIEWLKRFQFKGMPQVVVDLHGVINQPQTLRGRVSFEAHGLKYGSYECTDLRADAEYHGDVIDVTRLHLKDHLGEVVASAIWKMGAPDLRFNLTSSADLPGLATAFLNNDNLREVVFYEAPHLALNGIWHVGGEHAKTHRPVHATGQCQFGRFSTRGEMFDSLVANVGVAPEGVYVRDLLLRHKSGTLSVQAMLHNEQGFKYQAILKMDPNAFVPFLPQEQAREALQRFQFRPDSGIYVELSGSGPHLDFQKCVSTGRGELRNFQYRGVELELMAADIELQSKQQIFRNVKLNRSEGEGEAAEVVMNPEEKWVRLAKVKTQLDPVAVTECFAPKTAIQIAKYRPPVTTNATLDGTIGWKSTEWNDFKVQFNHPEGPAHYQIGKEDYAIYAPAGELTFKKDVMQYEVRGRVHDRPMSASGTVNIRPGVSDFSVVVKAATFPYAVFGKKLPFERLTAELKRRRNVTTFDIDSQLLGGDFSLDGQFQGPEVGSSFSGEMRVENINFRRFAEHYASKMDTEGDITGHFKFNGRVGDWKSLKGGGVLIALNGDLDAVPIFGPLSPLLGTLIPTQIKGYNVAKEANCTFDVADGFVMTDDFEALTSAFRISSKGRIDFINDDLDFTAQVRIRGLAGIVLMPFSELVEYRGTGSISKPKWHSTLLSVGTQRKDKGGREPTENGIREAERIGGSTPKPVGEPSSPARQIKPLFQRLRNGSKAD